MIYLLVSSLLIWSPLLKAATEPATEMSLQEIFRQAQSNRAQTLNAAKDVDASQVERNQLISGLYPTVTARQNNQFIDPVDLGGTVSRFGEPFQQSSLINLRQPLFQGGSEYRSIQVANNLPLLAELREKVAQLALLQEIASPFFEIRSLQSEKPGIEKELSALKDQIQTLRKWTQIGRARKAELLVAESQQARLQAQLILLDNNLERARIDLSRYLSGQRVESVAPFQLGGQASPSQTESQANKAPQVEILELEKQQLELERKRLSGEYLPTITLDANYYLQRAGILADSKWDANIQLIWELYRGRQTDRSRMLAQISTDKKINELQQALSDLEINLQRNMRQQTATTNEIKSLKQALDLTENAHIEIRKESRLGLVNTLEELRALANVAIVYRTHALKLVELERLTLENMIIRGALPK